MNRLLQTARRPLCRPRTVHTLLAVAALLALAPAQAAEHFWTAGSFIAGLTAPNPLPAGDTLFGLPGSNDKNFTGIGFTNLGTVAWQTGDSIGFVGSNVFNVGLWDLQADASLVYAGGSLSNFVNDGVFRKSGGAGSSVIGNNLIFTNQGVIDAQAGTIDFAGGSVIFKPGTQFTGAGVVQLSQNANFIGAFSSDNLRLAGGSFIGDNTTPAVMQGTVRWAGGNFAGTWQVAAGQTLLGVDGADKNFTGANFTNLGTVAWQSSERIGFVSSNLLNAGTWDLQADTTLAYAGGSLSNFSNTGTLRKSAGAGSAVFGPNIVFANSGVIEAASGSIDFAGGSTAFNPGTQFTGAGVNRVSGNASFIGGFVSQNLELAAGGFSGDNTTPAVLGGQVRWTGGSFTGTWQVGTGQTLTAQDGGDKSFSGTAFTNFGTVAWQSAASAGFVNSSVSNAALWDIGTDAGLAYVRGGVSVFTNLGSFRKSAGAGVSVIGSNIAFVNSGVIEALSGEIDFASGLVNFQPGSLFVGTGVVRVSQGATFIGGFTSQNLLLSGGRFFGDNTTPAALAGQAVWTGGSFGGTWQIGAGQTLTARDGTAKVFDATLFTNSGTVAWESSEPASFTSSAVGNTGLWDMRSDAALAYASGGVSVFSNAGWFRKSAGAGSTVIGNNIQFTNSGVVEAQTGSIDFAGGLATFLPGTQFTGAGVVHVSNNASFVGGFTASNLHLDSGLYSGDNTTPAVLGGQVTWTSGRFNGSWQVAAGQTLTAQDGADKGFAGALFTNDGSIVWASAQPAGFESTAFVNAGLFDLRADADLAYTGGAISAFTNTGVLRKSGGAGTSTVSGNIAFANPGSIEALSGTLRFVNNLANTGSVRGTATLQTPLLGNDGLLAPGASAGSAPATLTLAGSFAQGVAGRLQVDVESLASHDLLLVTGPVSLGGTLEVACFGNCVFAVGDEMVVLDYDGTRNGSQFAGLTLSGFASGGFETVYDDANTRVLLRASEALTPVPEPGPAALLLAGLAVVGWVVRRHAGAAA